LNSCPLREERGWGEAATIRGMAQQLSPKKYIQTKARSLPIYKAYVNKDWEEGKMAQVIVMRRHVNGNITAGVYLVDLLCLGVKDTMFIFNETQAEIEERFGDEFKSMFEEVDYNLAHNIVYAGHDFAMDYEIKPHADFAVTKFVLEEDNDEIPLIEVEVGTDDKPHLMVAQAGQYSDALAKLKKIAGEGNYYYTIGSELDDEDEEEDEEFGFDDGDEDEEEGDEDETEGDDDSDDSFYDMDEFDMGEITPLQAQFIYADDLMDEERVEQRVANEVLTIQTEVALRTLKEIDPSYFEHAEKEKDIDLEFLQNENYASGVTVEQAEAVITVQEQLVKFYEGGGAEKDPEASTKLLLKMLQENSDNPTIVANIFENGLFIEEKVLTEPGKAYLVQLSDEYPLAQLTLALSAFIKDEETAPYESIYNSQNLAGAFADKNDLAEADISTYSLLQTLVKLRQGDLRLAVYYYYLAAETEVFNWLLPVVQTAMMDAIASVVKDSSFYEGDEDDEQTGEEDTDDDSTNDDNEPTLRIV